MHHHREKPGVTFWATAVTVVGLVAYPLSFGPACWLADRGILPRLATARIFAPLLENALGKFESLPGDAHSNRPSPLTWWADLGARSTGTAERLWRWKVANESGYGRIVRYGNSGSDP